MMGRDDDLPRLNMGHWTKTSGTQSEEVYEFAPYKTEVLANEPDMAEAERQLAHAREQQELASQYPGRVIRGPWQ
jgi:hypothetical protein